MVPLFIQVRLLMISILASGGSDYSVRLWSMKRGDLLFQINTPELVNTIIIDENESLYVASAQRLLVFQIRAHAKEDELPPAW